MAEIVLGWQEKHRLVYEYAQPYGILVETGLYNGGGATTTIANMHRGEGPLTLYALDISRGNVDKARAAGVQAFQGDSAVMLPQLLERIQRPACFWLDAHTASEGDEEDHSPLMAELDAILAWPHAAASTVLVDDLRMYGREGWPSLKEILLALGFPFLCLWGLQESDDILRLTPR